MEFGAPQNLVYIWLVPVAVFLLFLAEKSRVRRLKMLGVITAGRPAPISKLRTAAKMIMTTAALTSLVLALSKPRWGFDWVDVRQRGADVMIAVDVSKSMLAPDISPSRLERARRKVSDLLDRMRGDRVGLVAFAGTAFVQCPLTMDYGAIRLFLSYLDPDLIPTQGTDLAAAVDMSLAGLFEGGSDDNASGRAIIIMTDGEDLEGRGLKAAEQARAKGVKVYTLGIGTDEGTLIPEAGGGFKKDRQGNLVISRPNEGTLKAMAAAGGGSYIRSVAGDDDIQYIYDRGILNDVARDDQQEVRTKKWHERFQWFLAAALLLLFTEPLIRDVRMGRRGILFVPFIALVFGLRPDDVWAASLGKAQELYKNKQYEEATKEFKDAEAENPDNPEITYNRAVSQFRNGDFAGASEGFGRAAGSQDPKLQEKSWYNLGNSLAYQQKFSDAVKAYENALQVNPENKKAQENLALVKKLLEQQKQQKQQESSDKSDDKKKDNQQENDSQQDQNDQENEKNQNGKDQDQKNPQQNQNQDQAEDKQSVDKQASDQNSKSEDDKKESEQDPTKDKQQAKNDQQNSGAGEQQDRDEKSKQQEQAAKDDPNEQRPDGSDKSATVDQSNHNQEESKVTADSKESASQQPAQQLSKDQAMQLLRSVQDQIKKYRYLDQSGGAGDKKEPEKDW